MPDWHKNRHKDQWNGIVYENTYSYITNWFLAESQGIQWGEDAFPTYGGDTIGYLCIKTLTLNLISYTASNLKWIRNPNIKAKVT